MYIRSKNTSHVFIFVVIICTVMLYYSFFFFFFFVQFLYSPDLWRHITSPIGKQAGVMKPVDIPSVGSRTCPSRPLNLPTLQGNGPHRGKFYAWEENCLLLP